MKALVTGGTGFIGQYLLRQLNAAGYACRALARQHSDTTPLADLHVEWVQGDITDASSLQNIAKGTDIVYHLAATGHVTALSKEAYKRFHAVNVAGTYNLVQACVEAGVSRFVHFSSTAAMGLIHLPLIDETAPCQPMTPYQRSKRDSEQVVLTAWRERGLIAVILRPCMVYGPGGKGEFLKMCQLMARGIFPRIGKGPNLTPMVHVDDVVQAAFLAGERGKPGEVYLIAGEGSFALDEIRALVLKHLGLRRPYPYMPTWLAMAGAFAFELLSKMTAIAPPVTRQNIASTIASRVFDITKAKTELGYQPRVGLEEGIKKTVAWFREKGYL